MYLPSLHLKGIIQQLLKNSDARHVIRHTKKGRKQSKVLQNQLSFQNKKIYSNPWTQNWVTVQSCREEKLYGLGHHSSFKYPPFWRISRLQLRKGQWKQIFFSFPHILLHCIYEPSEIQTSMQDENAHIWHFWASTYSGCPQTIFSPFCLVIKLFEARDSFLACKTIWIVTGKFLIRVTHMGQTV